MIRSMTGYGVADGVVGGGRLRVEVRTVNHRHFNVHLKLSSDFQHLEPEIKERIRDAVARGHVAASVRWLEQPSSGEQVSVDLERARALLAALNRLKEELELDGTPDLPLLARQQGILGFAEGDDGSEIPPEELYAVMDEALGRVIDMRSREGGTLAEAIGAILDSIDRAKSQVERLAPERLERERIRLRANIDELMRGHEVDEARLAQELAHQADRLDITEELVRLGAHLDACRTALDSGGPVGKRLGFLSQEMLREINTIGSKANDAGIAHLVIDMKGEVEKFKEQLENVE